MVEENKHTRSLSRGQSSRSVRIVLSAIGLRRSRTTLHTVNQLLVAGEVDGLDTSLLDKSTRRGLDGGLEAGPACCVDSGNEGALLDLRSLELPQRGAESSAGVFGGHCDGCDVSDEWREKTRRVSLAKDNGSVARLPIFPSCRAKLSVSLKLAPISRRSGRSAAA